MIKKHEYQCGLIYSSRTHFKLSENVKDKIKSILNECDFDLILLPDKIESDESYFDKIIQWLCGVDLCIIIMDGLRPNVIFEYGIATALNKDKIVLCGEDARVSVKTLYRNPKDSQIRKNCLKQWEEPKIDFNWQFSDRGNSRHLMYCDFYSPDSYEDILKQKIDSHRKKIQNQRQKKEIEKIISRKKEILHKTSNVCYKLVFQKDLDEEDLPFTKGILIKKFENISISDWYPIINDSEEVVAFIDSDWETVRKQDPNSDLLYSDVSPTNYFLFPDSEFVIEQGTFGIEFINNFDIYIDKDEYEKYRERPIFLIKGRIILIEDYSENLRNLFEDSSIKVYKNSLENIFYIIDEINFHNCFSCNSEFNEQESSESNLRERICPHCEALHIILNDL